MTTSPRAMFPLGDVAVPTQRAPLQVFEPRYLALLEDVMAGDRSFGICLIERGSEVGGGDQRLDIGTLVEVTDTRRLPDGRWLVNSVGRSRLRVERWHPDDPYPLADVEDYPDPEPLPAEAAQIEVVRAHLVDTVTELLVQRGMKSSHGWLDDVSDDASTASFQMAARCPVGAFDRYRLLAAPTVGLRLALMTELIDELSLRGGPSRDGG